MGLYYLDPFCRWTWQWIMMRPNGEIEEMDQDLRNVLESAKWDKMDVNEKKDATTIVKLSNREGHFALLTLDWQAKLINKLVSKIDIELFPH